MDKKQKRNAYEHAYKQSHYKRIIALIPKENNQDLINFIESKKSISSYVYELIQKDFKQQQEKN